MERELTMGQRIAPIIILAIVVVFLMRPVSFKIPLSKIFDTRRHPRITLDMAGVPVVGVLILLACGSINGDDVRAGIVGDARLQPYAVLILFFALAYLCLSLNVTGIFDYIAVKTILSAKGSGKRLFFALFILSTILTIITSNDIVILTLTQIILSLAKMSKSDPLPFLILEFFMANIWSAFFLIGNATNIIVAQAYGIEFVQYLKWMVLPTIATGFTAFGLIFLRFRAMVPDKIPIPDIEAGIFFKDKMGAIVGTACVIGRLILLVASGSIKQVPIWALTLIFSGIMFVRDIVYDVYYGRTLDISGELNLDNNKTTEMEEGKKNNTPADESTVSGNSDSEQEKEGKEGTTTTITVPNLDNPSAPKSSKRKAASEEPATPPKPVKPKKPLQYVTPTVMMRLPWKIVPFLLSVFIIVQALIVAGWTSEIAKGFSLAIGSEDSPATATASTFLLGGVSSLACNLLNNQPMTILFARVLADANFTVGERATSGAIFGLILGSNFGANLTPVGALAGIMWYAILTQRNYELPFFQFVMIGFTIMPLAILISCGVLALEVSYWPIDFVA